MPQLRERIAAEAAQALALDLTSRPAESLDSCRKFLKRQMHRLKRLHQRGAGGREICQARSALVDAVLQALWAALRRQQEGRGETWGKLALVALGGYGRGELNPQSNVDLLLLHDGQTNLEGHPALRLVHEGWLAGWGWKVSHAARTPEACADAARQNFQNLTALLEARLVAGEESLFRQAQLLWQRQLIAGQEEAILAACLEEQAARHARFGNSAVMQEPHIKNGCGGLRDCQNLLWMTRVKHGVSSLEALVARQWITPAEARQWETARDFLLRVRNEMHYQAGRAEDFLSKNLQPRVAYGLGYKDRSPRVRLEKFMRDYYTHSRRIYLLTRNLGQRLALAPLPKRHPARLAGRRRPSAAEAVDGLLGKDGRLTALHPAVFDKSPRRLMRVFLLAQQRGLELHPELATLIRAKLNLVTPEFRTDSHVRETFLAILGQRGNVAPVLRAMHETGLLGAYLPEFGRLTNRVQHEFFHQYTADEHTLMCLEMLDRVWDGRQPPYAHYTSLLQSLEQPYVLYLALLLHDIGKAARRADHVQAGGRLARRVARRLALDSAATDALCFLVRHHLDMIQISQRRDLEDPAVIQAFAALVGNEEYLKSLTLLTFADTLGTSAKLWNGFKDSLLQTLYRLTAEALRSRSVQPAENRLLERRRREVERLLPPSLPLEEWEAHCRCLPPRYFLGNSARAVVEDLALVHRFLRNHIEGDPASSLNPVVAWRDDPDRACTEVKICTWDRPRLFSRLAGAFSAAGIHILSAHIFSRLDGIALDTFEVAASGAGGPVGAEARAEFLTVLQRAMQQPELDLQALLARRAGAPPLYERCEGELIPTRIRFDNTSSEQYTIIEVETEDRLGLLYTLVQEMALLGLDIVLAKICTEKGAALDAFYVRHRHGGKVTAEDWQQRIREKLAAAIQALDRR